MTKLNNHRQLILSSVISAAIILFFYPPAEKTVPLIKNAKTIRHEQIFILIYLQKRR